MRSRERRTRRQVGFDGSAGVLKDRSGPQVGLGQSKRGFDLPQVVVAGDDLGRGHQLRGDVGDVAGSAAPKVETKLGGQIKMSPIGAADPGAIRVINQSFSGPVQRGCRRRSNMSSMRRRQVSHSAACSPYRPPA